jgi:small conductance mechanosensitive channel
VIRKIFDAWQADFIVFLPKLAYALIIFIVSFYIAQMIGRLMEKVLARRRVDPGAVSLLSEMTRWGIIVFGTITALQQFTDITAFLAGLGILGFTVGFALQDVMKNFAAGILLLLQRPFVVGDTIAVSDISGTVMDINLRATEIRTFDGRTIIFPNADALNHAITNFTRSVHRRIDVSLRVAFDTDLNVAREAVLEGLESVPGQLEDPAPVVVFDTFGESYLSLTASFWIDTAQINMPAAKDAAVKFIKQAFDKHGIEIPFPMRTMIMPEKK